MTGERLYRIHWAQRTGSGTLIRWKDLRGKVAAVREAVIEVLAGSAERAVRLQLAIPIDGQPRHVITGLAGLRAWTEDAALPPHTPNRWSERLEAASRRASTASDMKAKLLAASEAGLLDLATAARLADALDLALAAGVIAGHSGDGGT